MIDPRSLDQAAAAEQMALGRLDVPACARDGRRQRRPQPPFDLAVGGLEPVGGGEGREAEPQVRLRLVDEQADHSVPASVPFQVDGVAALGCCAREDLVLRRGPFGAGAQSRGQIAGAPRGQVGHAAPEAGRPFDRFAAIAHGPVGQSAQAQGDGAAGSSRAVQIEGDVQRRGPQGDQGLKAGVEVRARERRQRRQVQDRAGSRRRRGQGLGVRRREHEDDRTLLPGLGGRGDRGIARGDGVARGQDGQGGGAFCGLDGQVGGLALNGAQDVSVARAAAPRRQGRARQGGIGGRIGAGLARALAAVDGGGHVAQRPGQGLCGARGQPAAAPAGGLVGQALGHAGLGQVDPGQEGVRRRRDRGGQAQQHGGGQFGFESPGLGRRGQHAGLAPLGRQAGGPAVQGAVQRRFVIAREQGLGVGPVQPGLDAHVGPVGGRRDPGQGVAALDLARLEGERRGEGSKAGLEAHSTSPRVSSGQLTEIEGRRSMDVVVLVCVTPKMLRSHSRALRWTRAPAVSMIDLRRRISPGRWIRVSSTTC
ncbi:hypothetical protein D3C80_979030 [compost metagenome]